MFASLVRTQLAIDEVVRAAGKSVVDHAMELAAGALSETGMGNMEGKVETLLREIRSDLRSVSHVSNQDVADWAADYPEQMVGFGSVDLRRDADYVDKTLHWIADNGLRSIKLLPFSQFFNPAESENAERVMAFCREQGMIVLSHTGCAAGVFESPYLSAWYRISTKSDSSESATI